MSLQRQNFLLIYLNILSAVPAGFEPATFRLADRHSPSWANQAGKTSWTKIMTNDQNQVNCSWQIFMFEWSHLRILSIDLNWVRTSLYRGEFWACGPLKGSYVLIRTLTDYAIPWSMAVLFSAWFSMSFENHSLNSSCESNSVGIMKWSKAHSCQWEQAKAVRKSTQTQKTMLKFDVKC